MPQHRSAAVVVGGMLLVTTAIMTDDPNISRGMALAEAVPTDCRLVATDCRPDQPAGFRIGDIAPADRLHPIATPGAYGLADPPEGYAYAVLDEKLIRIDVRSGQIQSVLWSVAHLPD